MSRIHLSVILLVALSCTTQAESVALKDLGMLNLEFTPVEQIESYSGRSLAARVAYRPGEAVSLVTPHRVQQIRYLVGPGDTVVSGQAIAVMSGPEIHHFLTEFEVTEQRLATTKKRFDSNRKLYQNRAIDEARWIEISESYYALQLQYEHMRHFHDLLSPDEKDEDSITLNSPSAGVLQYRQESPGIDAGEELALLLPADTLRFSVSVPISQRKKLSTLASANCELKVGSVSGIASDFFVQAWSEPLLEQCQFLPGERLLVTPHYSFEGYSVPREAVFQWNGEPTVLLREDGQLVTVAVTLLSSDGETYAVACPTEIAGGEILSSSVSAVQGVLMGLGGE